MAGSRSYVQRSAGVNHTVVRGEAEAGQDPLFKGRGGRKRRKNPLTSQRGRPVDELALSTRNECALDEIGGLTCMESYPPQNTKR